MRYRARGLPTLLALCAASLFHACGNGDEPVEHGLEIADVTSDPRGEPVEVGFAVPDGLTYLAEISMRTDFTQSSNETGRPEVKSASASAVLEIEQTFLVPGGGRAPRSSFRLRYTKADGPNMGSFVDREPIHGEMDHEAGGRALRETLRLEGGTQAEQEEALDRIGGLLFAGYAGSPPWLPDRPVRVGEAWKVEGFIRPRGMDNAEKHARRLGMKAPRPTLAGTIRVAGRREVEGQEVLDLEIDALIEITGVLEQSGRQGRMSYGNRVQGTARISIGTGLPVTFDVTESIRTDTRAGTAKAEQKAVSRVVGTVRIK